MNIDASAVIVAIVSSGFLTAIMNRAFAVRDKKKEAKSGETEALRLLLKDKIRSLCLSYIEQGFVYADELEDLLSGHKIYHNKLGGNGYLDILIDKVKQLPVKGDGHH